MPDVRGLPSGTIVAGEWKVERMLGAGGFGVTYEAHSRKTGAHVALKEYMPSGLCTRPAGSTAVTPAQGPAGDIFNRGLAGFMKEAETLARLDHSSIVKVTGYFEANGTAYMALAYLLGGSVADWLKRLGRRPTQAESDQLSWPLTEALREVHALFVLHRDIKPDNIMLQADGTPVLIDFGAIKSLVTSETRSIGAGTLNLVTDGYAPPEQYVPDGESLLGPWTDVYALGATVYEAITGRKPPSSPRRQIDDTHRPLTALSPEEIGTGWRPGFLAGIDRALSLKRSDRPQSAMEFRQAIGLTGPAGGTKALSEIATELAAAAVPPVSFSGVRNGDLLPPPPPGRRTGLAVAVGVAALVLAGGAWTTRDRWLPQPDRGELAIKPITQVVPPPQAPAPNAANDSAGRRAREAEAARRRAEMEAADKRARAKQLTDALEKEVSDRAAAEKERQRLAALGEEERRRREIEEARRRDPALSVQPGSGQTFRDCPTCPQMVVVPAGRFIMGSPASEADRSADEGPQRVVTIAKPFAVGKFEVTFAEWDACVAGGGCQGNKSPSDEGWGKGRRPVINVSWDDITGEYLPWLNRKLGLSGSGAYRLLTEAEWEYAARATTTTRYFWGDDFSNARANNDKRQTVDVGQYAANAWGLHDMHGNVWEWTEDCYVRSYSSAPTDGSSVGPSGCVSRVLRGGGWNNAPQNLRSADRSRLQPGHRYDNLGFRLARTLSP